VTRNPDEKWITQQLTELKPVFESNRGKTALVRDRDTKFSKAFDQFFDENKMTTIKIPFRSPNMNPYAESWVSTIKRECLDHFLVLGQIHLEYLVKEFVHYYNTYRPHSGKDNLVLGEIPTRETGAVYEKSLLGGLTHHYYRG